MPQIRCPVLGCGKRKDEWGGRKGGYPLPSSNVFTLLLSTDVDVSINNRICDACSKRHRATVVSLQPGPSSFSVAPNSSSIALFTVAVGCDQSCGWITHDTLARCSAPPFIEMNDLHLPT